MNTIAENQNDSLKPGQKAARKKLPSKLDPFTDELLRMDAEKKSLHDMQGWLELQGVETSLNNLSVFLVRRRAREQFDGEKGPIEAFQEWLAENPHATMEAVIERFKMVALSLALQKEAAPAVLKLAARLAGMASQVANDRSRADYRERKLFMEEAKHAEWVKCEQTRALELCLAESRKDPTVRKLFREAFVALKAIRSPVLWREDGLHPMPASFAKAAATG